MLSGELNKIKLSKLVHEAAAVEADIIIDYTIGAVSDDYLVEVMYRYECVVDAAVKLGLDPKDLPPA